MVHCTFVLIGGWALGFVADAAPAGEVYSKGVKLLEEKKFAEAAAAFEEALRYQPAETPYLKYRNEDGRHKHAYYPLYQLALARVAQTEAEPNLYTKRERLQAAERGFRQTAHREGKNRLAEVRVKLEELEKAIAEAEAAAPPQALVDLRTKVERLAEGENYEEAFREMEAGASLFERREVIRTNLTNFVQNRQKATLERYDNYLLKSLTGVGRIDPTIDADLILSSLLPARVPPEVTKTPAPHFKWVIDFVALYEKEIERIRAATTLPPEQLLPSATAFDQSARKAVEIGFFPGFRLARNVGQALRIARLREHGNPEKADPSKPDYRPIADAVHRGADEAVRALEGDLQGQILQAGETPLGALLKKYLEGDIPYQRNQIERYRKLIDEAIKAYDQRVAAEATVKKAEDGLVTPRVMADPGQGKGFVATLSTLASQPYFDTLPDNVRAKVHFARAVCEAVVVFLEAESTARAVERCEGDVVKAFALDPQVDATWREGRLSPRIVALFDSIKQR